MNNKQQAKYISTLALKNEDPAFRALPTYSSINTVFVGPAGSGKTRQMKEVATSINRPLIAVRFSQEPFEDMSYPDIQTSDNGTKRLGKIIAEMFPRRVFDENGEPVMRRTVIDGEIVTTEEQAIDFEAVKNYIENYDEVKEHFESLGLSINDSPGGIFFMDEMNRVEEASMFQMLFQILESKKFKGFQMPEEITIFAAINPPNGNYMVKDWFGDDAFSNRVVFIRRGYDAEDWIKDIAPKAGYSDLSRTLVDVENRVLFDPEDNNFDIPQPKRSYRNMSYFETAVVNIDWDDEEIEKELVTSILGVEFVGMYQKAKQDLAERPLSPEQILTEYDPYELGDKPFEITTDQGYEHYKPVTLFEHLEEQDVVSPVREKMLQMIRDGRKDYTKKVMSDLIEHINKNIKNPSFEKMFDQNRLRFIRFVLDLDKGDYRVFFRELTANQEQSTKNLITKLLAHSTSNIIGSKAFVNIISHIDEQISSKYDDDKTA